MNKFLPTIFAIFTCWLCIAPAQATKRIALVVGNDNYSSLQSSQQLYKARNDARSVGDALEAAGFSVIRSFDASRQTFNRKISELAQQIEPGDTVAFFYAGHGVRIGGSNYLLPSDIPYISGGQKELLIAESIDTERIISQMRQRGARVSLLILDACRNNPFQDKNGRSIGGSRGLAIMDPPEGTFILYSAGANQVALDRLSDNDANPNSLFTRTLLPYLGMRGLEISTMATQVRRKVRSLALKNQGHNQTPAVYNDLISDFYLLPPTGIGTSAAQSQPRNKVDQYGGAYELSYWNTVKNSKVPSLFEAYLRRYPKGIFVELAEIKLAELAKRRPASTNSSQAVGKRSKKIKPRILILPVVTTSERNEKKKSRLAVASASNNDNHQDKAGRANTNVTSARLEPSGKENLDQSQSRSRAISEEKIGKEIVRQIQQQLNRVDCSRISVDGAWGKKSQRALIRAKKRKGLKFNPQELSLPLLSELKAQKAARCTLKCSVTKVEKNGRCVAKTCSTGMKLSSKGNCYKKKNIKQIAQKPILKAKPRTRRKTKAKRLCMLCNTWSGESLYSCGTRRFLQQEKVERQCWSAVIK